MLKVDKSGRAIQTLKVFGLGAAVYLAGGLDDWVHKKDSQNAPVEDVREQLRKKIGVVATEKAIQDCKNEHGALEEAQLLMEVERDGGRERVVKYQEFVRKNLRLEEDCLGLKLR